MPCGNCCRIYMIAMNIVNLKTYFDIFLAKKLQVQV